MRYQPLLYLALFAIGGIVLAEYWEQKTLRMILLAAYPVLLGLLIFWQKSGFRDGRSVLLGVLAFGLFFGMHWFSLPSKTQPAFAGKQTFLFEIDKKLNSSEKYRRYQIRILKVEEQPKLSPFFVVMNVPKNELRPDFAHYYQTEAYVNQVSPPSADFQFNYAKYLSRQRVFYQIFTKEKLLPQPKTQLSLYDQIRQKRLDILQNIDDSSLEERPKQFLKGIILADRTDLDAVTNEDFTQTGLVHLLAISGGHMVLIFWVVLAVLGVAAPFVNYQMRVMLALGFIWLFSIFIDYGFSVIRSSLMITIYYMYVLLQRQPSLLHSAALSALILLVADTNALFDAGFQLSYAAVLGIIFFNDLILAKITTRPRHKWVKKLEQIASITLSAQLGTLPVVLIYFHQYNLMSLLYNLFIIPLSELFIIFSLLMTPLFAFHISPEILNLIYSKSVSGFLYVIHFLAQADFLMSREIPFSFGEFLAMVGCLFCLYFWLKNFRQSKWIFLGSLLFFAVVRLSYHQYWRKTEEILPVKNFREQLYFVKKGNAGVAIIPEKYREASQRQKLEKNLLSPYRVSRRVKNLSLQFYPEGTEKVSIEGKEFPLEGEK